VAISCLTDCDSKGDLQLEEGVHVHTPGTHRSEVRGSFNTTVHPNSLRVWTQRGVGGRGCAESANPLEEVAVPPYLRAHPHAENPMVTILCITFVSGK
jgi:hypothetical protein